MLVLPTIRQLRYFVALAETLSFSKAAENSYVTQSTLSASIKDLEDIIGCALFERHSRQVLLTDEGHKFLKKTVILLENLQDMVLEISENNSPLSGTLRLAVIPTIAPFILPQLIKRITTAYPQLDLQIEEAQSQEVVEKLEKGLYDVGLIAFPYPTANCDSLELYDDVLYLATNKKNMKKTSSSVTIDELDQYKLILLEDGHCLRGHIVESCFINAHQHHAKLKPSSLETLINLVDEDLGDTLIPHIATKKLIEHRENISLVPLFDKNKRPSRKIGLIWRKSSVQRKSFELLGQLIKSALEEL